MLPRGTSGIWLLRVQTTNSVEPGRYSQRSTALPRSDRNVKVGSVNRNVLLLASVSPSASRTIWAEFADGLEAGCTHTAPKSRPYSRRCADRGAANTL